MSSLVVFFYCIMFSKETLINPHFSIYFSFNIYNYRLNWKHTFSN